jgi:hypothetical protein
MLFMSDPEPRLFGISLFTKTTELADGDSTSLITANRRDESRKNAGCNHQEKLNSNRPAKQKPRYEKDPAMVTLPVED